MSKHRMIRPIYHPTSRAQMFRNIAWQASAGALTSWFLKNEECFLCVIDHSNVPLAVNDVPEETSVGYI